MTKTLTKEDVLQKLFSARPKAIQRALNKIGDIGMAEDIVQDAYIKILKRIDHLESWDGILGYFFLSVEHSAINEWRNRKRKKYSEYEDINNYNNIQDTARTQEISTELKEHLEKLPPNLQLPIMLQYVMDYTQEEVAVILNIPIGTVKSRNFRALNILKKQLTCEKQPKKELKPGQPVWDRQLVVILDHQIEDRWVVADFNNAISLGTLLDPIPLTEDEFLLYCEQELGWKIPTNEVVTKDDGEGGYYIAKYKGKWILHQKSYGVDKHGDLYEGYWPNSDDIEDTIRLLKECKIIVECLNSIN